MSKHNLNGDFETGTTGWVALGSGSIARSTTVANFGVASLRGTGGGANLIAGYDVTLRATTYSLSGYVYVPTAYVGGAEILLGFTGFTGATGTTSASQLLIGTRDHSIT